jgi:riboflavin synthase
MFTGIIEAVASVADVTALGEEANASDGGRRLTLEVPFAGALAVGDSLAVDGACLTAVSIDERAGAVAVEAVEETLRKTTLGARTAGDRVNIERALEAGARLDGHFVQGHVDATGRVEAVTPEDTGRLYRIGFEAGFARYLIPTGSVAVDGISLTVARLDDEAAAFTVAVVPHTYEATTVAERWMEGAAVNLEFDMIGKYVAGGLDRGSGDMDFAP